ncbi:MAG: winged helix DNA-binding domain-containing protein [Parvibaculum sp.]|uniref:winged helix-turn-helix domain-containing protein n=1 Tax=Parvibaculum sp. TaxID=2024848 RepID=UPI0025E25AF5|nr:crosslink repair DNA glycosylase YcaQ family protein [Parvibaculum sp.]MCE9648573.1 winged helix DNA-binding domain-containing protein [Parvibaculum sp.]
MTSLHISNADARRLFLDRHALTERPGHPLDEAHVLALIRKLGFVQLDSVNAVERAHHMILFSRGQGYTRDLLHTLHHDHAALFEHWTHDASLVPIEFYPHWHHRFRAAKERLKHPAWQQRLGPDGDKTIRRVRAHIRKHGPSMARDFEDKGGGGWWGWGPSKTALEFLWRSGELAIPRRDGFEKVYDLAEKVIPAEQRIARPTRKQTIDWACRAALERLGIATPQELAAFFALIDIAEAKEWAKAALKRKDILEVAVAGADGGVKPALSLPDIETHMKTLKDLHETARFLSPFDPVIRDRKRTLRLFGFDYTIEIFVPEKKRRYGYYVLPILEGDRFVGRADLKAHRAESRLEVKGLWLEPGVKLDKARKTAIESALDELGRFTGTTRVDAGAPLRRARAG